MIQQSLVRTSFFHWTGGLLKKVMDWIYPEKKLAPSDEVTPLLQRAMTPKSLFDKLSASWVKQPLWIKGATFLGVGLFFGLVGLLVDASLLCALSAIFVTTLGHFLLVSHEKKRLQGARTQVAETVALNGELRKNQIFFEEATRSMTLATTSLHDQSERLQTQSQALDRESQTLQAQDRVLSHDVEVITRETTFLAASEKAATQTLTTLSSELQTCSDSLSHAGESLSKLGASATQFANVVSECDQSQQQLRQTVNRFTLFVNQPKTPPDRAAPKDAHQALIDELRVENNADDILIEKMRSQMKLTIK
ncbi:MAG: hypothetical protein NTW94_09670 [Legionellales bacterium]|nr:hypothetical protein [Legionellales bacterium]